MLPVPGRATAPRGHMIPPPAPNGWRWERRGALLLLACDRLDEAGALHAFTTRPGGESAPPFDSLNLSRGVGDAPAAVVGNRRRALAALGRALEDHVEVSQVHGATVALVDAVDRGRKIEGADGLATSDPAVVLAVHTADCVPVLLADPRSGAVGAVHTGWRGTAAGAAAEAVAVMRRAFGADPRDLIAGIGPAIGPCCYEVDAVVAESYASRRWRDAVLSPGHPSRWQLDLWEANRLQLLEAGLRPEGISTARMCTAHLPELFFSHRRDGITGRMAALVARSLPGGG